MTTLSDPLQYSLRVASIHLYTSRRLLKQAQQSQSQPQSQAAPHTRSNSTTSATQRTLESQPSSSRFAFDFSSLIDRDKGKTPRFPEKLIKILDGYFQRIAMGQEPKYTDQRFRRSIAAFWSSAWADKTLQRQLKDTRRVEDIILSFVTTSTKSLKKDDEFATSGGGASGWQEELGNQVGMIIGVLLDGLVVAGERGGELRTRLEGYRGRVKTENPPATREKSISSLSKVIEDPKADTASASTTPMSSATATSELEAAVQSATEVLDAVGRLFGLSSEELKQKVDALSTVCTEQAAVDDFKVCLRRLNTENPYPYAPDDFTEPVHWSTHKSEEVATLSQMILSTLQSNPSLVESDRASISSLSAQLHELSVDGAGAHAGGDSKFTYIPPNSREVYRELLNRCLDHDLDLLATLPEDQEIPLSILSAAHFALLFECSKRWRLPAYFRSVAFLQAIVERYKEGGVPAACIREAEEMVGRVQVESPIESWALGEQLALEDTQRTRDLALLSSLLTSLDAPLAYLSEEFQESFTDWTTSSSPLIPLLFTDLPEEFQAVVTQVQEGIQGAAFSLYVREASERLDFEGGKKGYDFIEYMGTWLEKGAKRMDRRFQDPIIADVDIIHLVLKRQISLWFRDLEDVLNEIRGETERIQDHFALYRKACSLKSIGDAYSPPNVRGVKYPITKLFEPTVQIWLDETSLKTKEWSDQALAVDNFEPTTEQGPSSSVTDLFDSLKSAAEFLMELEWADQKGLAKFVTKLSKTISLSIDDYCSKLETLFKDDMRVVADSAITSSSSTGAVATAKEKVWVEKAKATLASLQGEKKLKAFFNFTPDCCVKLNNIEAARQRLDELYQLLQVDNLSAYDSAPTTKQRTYLFTAKIVLAEGLQRDVGNGALPDAFVTLSDEHGVRYAKTRTVYDDADPRWDESFDIPVRTTTWFMITIRHRNLTGKHSVLGRAYLQLDPAQFQDLITKDMMLPLDSRGHVLLRVSVEGEKDDMQFHFGRAFRCLKRTEGDMVRTFVDKMTPVLRHTLSRQNIKAVIKGNVTSPLAYNEALGKLTAVYRSALGTPEYIIPPTSAEKYRGPTENEIEAAIHVLFDYLDTNIHTLSTSLSKYAMQMVMAKLWKQILMTIEGLIVPPLSDKPSGMRALKVDELDVGLKWLKFLRDFFYVGGDESGVPLETLQNQKFNEILSLRIYYDWPTDSLMEECIKSFQSTLKSRSMKPSKSIRAQRNLGTIRARKTAKRAAGTHSGASAEMIMRILRMRPDTQEFLAQQLQTISVVKLENPKAARSMTQRR